MKFNEDLIDDETIRKLLSDKKDSKKEEEAKEEPVEEIKPVVLPSKEVKFISQTIDERLRDGQSRLEQAVDAYSKPENLPADEKKNYSAPDYNVVVLASSKSEYWQKPPERERQKKLDWESTAGIV